MLFGNTIMIHIDTDAVLDELTTEIKKMPNYKKTNLRLWVGAWRNELTWNHSKIVAVDGRFLHYGGHNLYDNNYIRRNPVTDISNEVEGPVAHSAHLFADQVQQFFFMCDEIHNGCTICL